MIAIIKYNAGNITSVSNAVERLGYECIVTDDVATIQQADKVIFPGVGEAHSAMQYLKQKGLDVVITNLTQPVLGICLGLQLMCNFSEEGNTTCMGIFNSSVLKFTNEALVPHMGWNNIVNNTSPIIPIDVATDYYFVHSYYAAICDDTKAICDYIVPFSAALQKNNFYATQFHPEKSAAPGAAILKNFLAL